jgi:hypothetical protein
MILSSSILLGADPKKFNNLKYIKKKNKVSFRLSNPGCGGGGSLLYTMGAFGSMAGGYFNRYFFAT